MMMMMMTDFVRFKNTGAKTDALIRNLFHLKCYSYYLIHI